MNDKERNEILLKSIDDLIEQAPLLGVCPIVFKTIKIEVERLIAENQSLLKYKESRTE